MFILTRMKQSAILVQNLNKDINMKSLIMCLICSVCVVSAYAGLESYFKPALDKSGQSFNAQY